MLDDAGVGVARRTSVRRTARIIIATKPVDFRKGHDGLAAGAERELGLDPHSGVFRAKGEDRIKVLLWGGSGIVISYK